MKIFSKISSHFKRKRLESKLLVLIGSLELGWELTLHNLCWFIDDFYRDNKDATRLDEVTNAEFAEFEKSYHRVHL
jgi:hypothetical protein